MILAFLVVLTEKKRQKPVCFKHKLLDFFSLFDVY